MTKRKPTITSSFGVSGRQSHDASPYYNRSLYEAPLNLESVPTSPDAASLDQLICESSETMSLLRTGSVALMVTSPSYHVGKDYDTDSTLTEYLDLLTRVFTETYRVLEPGGRAAINVAGLGRKPYIPLPDLVGEIMRAIGFLPRGEVIWQKGKGASNSVAWGSYMSPANPVLRDLHEMILIFSKDRFDRTPTWQARQLTGWPWQATITKEEFMAASLSVWQIAPESAKRIGHPAPFPVDLPRRLIEFYTFKGDLVLDPFMGSGTTAVAARRTGRRYVGFDTNQQYLDLAQTRLNQEPETIYGDDDAQGHDAGAAGDRSVGKQHLDSRESGGGPGSGAGLV